MIRTANFSMFFVLFFLFFGCNIENQYPRNETVYQSKQFNYLALGDSYTIGSGECATCRFPEQLKASLQNNFPNDDFLLQIIARSGWTTSVLKSEIELVNPFNKFDLVTLLIGVNNQYQNRPFSLYETEFPELVNKAIYLAKSDKSNLIVVSIPDYAFTPFGRGAENISLGVAKYNTFAKKYCDDNNILFINITDITQQGLIQPNLVCGDDLHPSKIAYAKFIERILPEAIKVLKN